MSGQLRGFLPAVALALIPAAGFAQATTGRISGRVADPQGGLLPGASVTATEVRTSYSRTAATDAQGAYVFVNLPLGTYSVSAEITGFNKEIKTGYVLVADGRLTADFNLTVGSINETVEVTVRGETVNTVSGEVARTVDRQQVQSLALNGRNYLQLTTLIPGAPRPQPERARHHDGPRHQHLDQRQPHERHPARGRRRLQHGLGQQQQPDQQRRHRLHRGGLDQDRQLLGGVRQELGRRHQHRDARGCNELPRQRLRVPAQRGARRQQLLQQRPQRGQARISRYNDFGGRARRPRSIKDKLFFFAGVRSGSRSDRFTNPTLRTLPTREDARRATSARSARPSATR